MTGRHRTARGIRGKWSFVVSVLSVFGLASFLLATPASAATTSAQLSFSGIVTTARPVGGSCVGVNPGDSVQFSAASVPTQGLTALGGDLAGLADTLNNLLQLTLGVQIWVKLPPAFPSKPAVNGTTVVKDAAGSTVVKLGKNAAATFTSTFTTKGKFPFSWTAYKLTLLGLVPVELSGAQLATLTNNNIAINASNEWQGTVVTDGTCPAGVSIQLPAVSAAPKVGPIQVPKVGLPGVTVPNVAVPIPSTGLIPSGTVPLPKKAVTVPGNPNGSGNVTGSYTVVAHPGDRVVPRAGACCGDVIGDNLGFGNLTGGGGAAFGRGLLSGFGSIPLNALAAPNAISGQVQSSPVAAPDKAESHKANLLRNLLPAGGMPAVLAVIAILALSVVAATYARLYLVRRDV